VTAAPLPAAAAIVAEPLTLARPGVARTSDVPVILTTSPGGSSIPPGRSATSSAPDLARQAATTGRRARDSGLNIARFFTRAGKRIAGGF
jgi:hypothetical protein